MMGLSTQFVKLVIIPALLVLEEIQQHFAQVVLVLLKIEYPQLILLPLMIYVIAFQDSMIIISNFVKVAPTRV